MLLQHFPLPHYLHNVAWIRPDSISSFVLANLSFVNLLEIQLELCFTLCLALASEMNPIRLMKRLATIVLLGMIAGCAQGPSPRESADADY
jgi:hypothetical protein